MKKRKYDRLDLELDKMLKNEASKEPDNMPDDILASLISTLDSLPQVPARRSTLQKRIRKIGVAVIAAAASAAVFVALPNISPNIANAMDDIPVIGNVVRAVTFRSYTQSDGNLSATISVPQVEWDLAEAQMVNDDIKTMTDRLIAQFNKNLENGGDRHQALDISYDVITNTNTWFTLKLSICETAASGNQYYKYYHIEKATGKCRRLSDLFLDTSYIDIITSNITEQMREQMDGDDSVIFWTDSAYADWDFCRISADQNFYFDSDGNIVIVFEKYDVAPGYMGCPEFTIPHELTDAVRK